MNSVEPPATALPEIDVVPHGSGAHAVTVTHGIPAPLLTELCAAAEAEHVGLTPSAFAVILERVGERHHYGGASGNAPDASARATFFRSLQLADLALAQACALGLEAAWQKFIALYRDRLTKAAIAITRSVSLGEELSDSLYAELYGLAERDGLRRSPLAGYSGRGSLMGWLRTTLAQRQVDSYRRTRRETAIEDQDFAAEPAASAPDPKKLDHLGRAVSSALAELDAESRFLLSAYFLDQRTLLEIARLLQVHEATVSRRIKRLTGSVHKRLLKELQAAGLSRRAAEETLYADPRDLSLNLRKILQTSHSPPFSVQEPQTKTPTSNHFP